MISDENHIISFVSTLFSIIFDLSTCLISIIIFICIIIRQYYTRIKRQKRIIFILCANIYLHIFLFSTIQLLLACWSLLGDLYEINFDLSWCIFNGFFITIVQSALYYGFVAQSFFRLCRIVYSQYRWLQFYWLYVIAIPIQMLIAGSIPMRPIATIR